MANCSHCNFPLEHQYSQSGQTWRCGHCRGHARTAFALKESSGNVIANQIIEMARKRKKQSIVTCPACGDFMLEVPLEVGEIQYEIDVCCPCQVFWFDEGEFEKLPIKSELPIEYLLQARPDYREAAAIARLDEIRYRNQEGPPDESWKTVFAYLGMPIEYDNPSTIRPVATWTLAGLCTLVFLLMQPDPTAVINQLGFIPDHAWRSGGITWLSPFFLHADFFHLLGNMYFLLVFGDNVEEQLGWKRYLLMLLVGSLVGSIFHSLGDPRGMIPCVGASDGISAIIVYYALQFPRERLGFMWWFYFRVHWITLPAFSALVLWFVYQIILAGFQTNGLTNVSALAHLSGAITGATFWWFRKVRQSTEAGNQSTRIQSVFK